MNINQLISFKDLFNYVSEYTPEDIRQRELEIIIPQQIQNNSHEWALQRVFGVMGEVYEIYILMDGIPICSMLNTYDSLSSDVHITVYRDQKKCQPWYRRDNLTEAVKFKFDIYYPINVELDSINEMFGSMVDDDDHCVGEEIRNQLISILKK